VRLNVSEIGTFSIAARCATSSAVLRLLEAVVQGMQQLLFLGSSRRARRGSGAGHMPVAMRAWLGAALARRTALSSS
jgi:hypothetical protein